MDTLLYTHPAFLAHNTGSGHPESPERLKAVWNALSSPEFKALKRREAPLGLIEQVRLVHNAEYVDAIMDALPSHGLIQLDPDTILSPGSGEALLRGVGATCAAVDAIMTGEAQNAFCAVRPCGHHAEPDRAMGFCIFNQIAIAAAHARAAHGLSRIAIVDFDVHHGNGTQAAFLTNPAFFYTSTHQSPLYPGTGSRSEQGIGNIVNIPLPQGTGSAAFQQAVESEMLPALETFKPDFILISAGFDAFHGDPLAGLKLEADDFYWITRKLMHLADKHCHGRIVSMLEGGYSISGLEQGSAAHVRALLER
ncbi:MAG: histone deacetylase family protein [Pseudomonadota bacterium]|nr:histone deacetylase family protein [Pseudomonadota bacterium]